MLRCIFFAVVLLSIHTVFSQTKDPVKHANEVNENKSHKGMVDEAVADFLVKSADARMMDKKEGSLALQKGTTAGIRKYGKKMVKDQSMLLVKIKQLAAVKKVTLPVSIAKKKEEGREDLAAKTGKEFDKKFIKMMKIDHERDIKLFEEATNSADKELREFAVKWLPLIQSHLEGIKALEQQQ